MKVYTLIESGEKMDMEEAIDFLQTDLHFTLDKAKNVEESNKQSELMEILIDSYFLIEDEEEEDYGEDDRKEREREYREMQGF
jgi:hypothetical protein